MASVPRRSREGREGPPFRWVRLHHGFAALPSAGCAARPDLNPGQSSGGCLSGRRVGLVRRGARTTRHRYVTGPADRVARARALWGVARCTAGPAGRAGSRTAATARGTPPVPVTQCACARCAPPKESGMDRDDASGARRRGACDCRVDSTLGLGAARAISGMCRRSCTGRAPACLRAAGRKSARVPGAGTGSGPHPSSTGPAGADQTRLSPLPDLWAGSFPSTTGSGENPSGEARCAPPHCTGRAGLGRAAAAAATTDRLGLARPRRETSYHRAKCGRGKQQQHSRPPKTHHIAAKRAQHQHRLVAYAPPSRRPAPPCTFARRANGQVAESHGIHTSPCTPCARARRVGARTVHGQARPPRPVTAPR